MTFAAPRFQNQVDIFSIQVRLSTRRDIGNGTTNITKTNSNSWEFRLMKDSDAIRSYGTRPTTHWQVNGLLGWYVIAVLRSSTLIVKGLDDMPSSGGKVEDLFNPQIGGNSGRNN